MTTTTEPNNTSPKRVRINSPVRTTTPPSSAVPPSQVAQERIASALMSLNTLVHPIAKSWSDKVIKLHSKISRQTQTLEAMAKPEYIPRSARIGFELTGSQMVNRLPAFTALSTRAKDTVALFHQEAKKIVFEAATMELAALKKAKSTAMVHGVILFGQVYIWSTGGSEPKPNILLHYVSTVLVAMANHIATNVDPEAQKQIFESLTGFKLPLPALDTNEFRAEDLRLFTAFCKRLFIAPSLGFDETERLNKLSLAVNTFNTLQLTEEATSNTVLTMDAEASLQPAQLQSLITTSLNKELVTLRATVKRLEKAASTTNNSEMTEKNKGRGASGASLKKKKAPAMTSTTKKSKSKKGATDPSPATPDNASSAASPSNGNAVPKKKAQNKKGSGKKQK
jgi:hypothetical protein